MAFSGIGYQPKRAGELVSVEPNHSSSRFKPGVTDGTPSPVRVLWCAWPVPFAIVLRVGG